MLAQIVRELTVHAEVEEQAVYPVMRAALPDGDSKYEEAVAEHREMKEMLSRIEGADPHDPELEKDVHALAMDLRHHVEEEETELFKELRAHLMPEDFTDMAEKAQSARRPRATGDPARRRRDRRGTVVQRPTRVANVWAAVELSASTDAAADVPSARHRRQGPVPPSPAAVAQ